MQEVVSTPLSVEAWVKLFVLPKLLFHYPPRLSNRYLRGKQHSHAETVAGRMERFTHDPLIVIQEFRTLDKTNRIFPSSNPESRAVTRAKSLAESGRLQSALQALAALNTAPLNEATVSLIQDLHPVHNLPTIQPGCPKPGRVTQEAVLLALKSFPVRTACDASGLQIAYIRHILSTQVHQGQSFAIALIAKIVSFLFAGQCPAVLAGFVTTSPLTPLVKPNGGLRPIAVGDIWRRLVSKVAVHLVRDKVADYLAPFQVGVGIKDGTGALVHATQALITHFGENSTYAMLKLDGRNAFNLANRGNFFNKVRAHFPDISAWVEYCYGVANPVLLGETSILCTTGVQQGDPLGPLPFALGIHPMVLTLRRRFPLLLANGWFLDDGNLIAPHDTNFQSLSVIKEFQSLNGFSLNVAKCELWWPKLPVFLPVPYPAELTVHHGPGIKLLGAPLGASTFAEILVGKRVEKIKSYLALLHNLEDAQLEFCILRACLSLPKFLFALRTCPPDHIPAAITAFDVVMSSALCRILGVTRLSPLVLQQSRLSVSLGGLGLPSASSRGLPAFIASVSLTAERQKKMLGPVPLRPEFLHAVQMFETKYPNTNAQPIPLLDHLLSGQESKPQRWLTALVDVSLHKAWFAALGPR